MSLLMLAGSPGSVEIVDEPAPLVDVDTALVVAEPEIARRVLAAALEAVAADAVGVVGIVHVAEETAVFPVEQVDAPAVGEDPEVASAVLVELEDLVVAEAAGVPGIVTSEKRRIAEAA